MDAAVNLAYGSIKSATKPKLAVKRNFGNTNNNLTYQEIIDETVDGLASKSPRIEPYSKSETFVEKYFTPTETDLASVETNSTYFETNSTPIKTTVDNFTLITTNVNDIEDHEAEEQNTELITSLIDDFNKDLDKYSTPIGTYSIPIEITSTDSTSITTNIESLSGFGGQETEARKTEFITSLIDDINKDLEKYTPTFHHKPIQEDEEETLTHTISFYRKQANARRLASRNITG